jgi:hypothetical protein
VVRSNSDSESEKNGSDPHHWQQVSRGHLSIPAEYYPLVPMPIAYLPLAAEYLAADSAENPDQFYTDPDLVFTFISLQIRILLSGML